MAIIGIIAVGGLAAAGSLTLTKNQANAADTQPACSVTPDSGKSCVSVDNDRGDVQSVRVNGQCLLFTNNPEADNLADDHFFPDVHVNSSGSDPDLLTFSGKNCEGGTQNSAGICWNSPGETFNYRLVNVSDEGCSFNP